MKETATVKTVNQFRNARLKGVPLIMAETSDPTAYIASCREALNTGDHPALVWDKSPVIKWDVVNGQRGCNVEGEREARRLGADPLQDPTAFLSAAANASPNTCVFLLNGHKYLANEQYLQAVWNLRDLYEADHRTLVILCPNANPPPEIKSDVIVITEAYPDLAAVTKLTNHLMEDEWGYKFADGQAERVYNSLLGYESLFAVKQALSLSLTNKAPDLGRLWALRVQALKDRAGIQISRPTDTFDNLVGCDGIKGYLGDYLQGRRPPNVIALWDELEKMMSGAGGGDLSGTTDKMLEQWLYWTENEKVDIALAHGIPGTGKTTTARCLAGQAGVPLARCSMSMAQGGIVGQSEAQMADMLKTLSALGQGRILMLCTSNDITSLKPEMVARCKMGSFFYPYPTEAQAEDMWRYYMAKYEIKGKHPKVDRWVGREIEQCCYLSWLLDQPLDKVQRRVVPICMANAQKMDALMRSADGRYNSANDDAVYKFEEGKKQATGRRSVLN